MKTFLAIGVRAFQAGLYGLILCGVVVDGGAQIFPLNNGNSAIQIDVNSAAYNWQVDGVKQLNQMWFYYRVGDSGPEAPIQSIGSFVTNSYVNLPFPAKLDVTYAGSAFSVRTLYQLIGGTAGSASSSFNQTLTVQNTSAEAISFHFFQYCDFDLGGVSGDQNAQFFMNDVTGDYYKLIQTFEGRSVTETVTPISHFEAVLDGSTLGNLTDGSATTLRDLASAGPGDVTYACQWDVLLDPGESFQVSKLLVIVPEPSAAGLLVVGLFLMAIVQRRRRLAQV